MNRMWDILGTIFMLVGVFLLLFYWKGAVEVIKAGSGALTDTISSLQGQVKLGNQLPSAYPK